MTVSAHRAHPREPVFQRESGKPMSRGATPRGVKRPWRGGNAGTGRGREAWRPCPARWCLRAGLVEMGESGGLGAEGEGKHAREWATARAQSGLEDGKQVSRLPSLPSAHLFPVSLCSLSCLTALLSALPSRSPGPRKARSTIRSWSETRSPAEPPVASSWWSCLLCGSL